MRLISIVLAVCSPILCLATEPKPGFSLVGIKQLALAVALADFPIPQGQLSDQIFGNLTKRAFGAWGSKLFITGTKQKSDFQQWTLTDPDSPSGYYSARLTYGKFADTPDKIPILAIELLFTSPNHLHFVYEVPGTLQSMLPKLKATMKEHGQTPREFAEIFLRSEEEFNSSSGSAPKSTEPAEIKE